MTRVIPVSWRRSGWISVCAIGFGIWTLIAASAVYAQTRQQQDTQSAVASAVTTERVRQLADRVADLEALHLDSRIVSLEKVLADMHDTDAERRKLEYGLIAGVGAQLILSGMQWRKR